MTFSAKLVMQRIIARHDDSNVRADVRALMAAERERTSGRCSRCGGSYGRRADFFQILWSPTSIEITPVCGGCARAKGGK